MEVVLLVLQLMVMEILLLLIITDHRIRVFRPDGTIIRKFGSKGSGDGQFDSPVDVAIDGDGNIVVSDCNNHRIQMFRPDGTFIRKFGSNGMVMDNLIILGVLQ